MDKVSIWALAALRVSVTSLVRSTVMMILGYQFAGKYYGIFYSINVKKFTPSVIRHAGNDGICRHALLRIPLFYQYIHKDKQNQAQIQMEKSNSNILLLTVII
ncbi:hypothetical protein TUM12370_20120 [Salmonella enterica subsp. enterica serovar Choleraesuis]|nr:hypothetical protein TUM12370_20120 [Salmonella enterica subsp. enterica serovar Choleraesuis]